MTLERIDYKSLIKSLQSGYDYLKLNYKILDNLNVFPVPDGDTGINMLNTMKPAVDLVKDCLNNGNCTGISDVTDALNEALTKNSRGNSGFILAQFFLGLSQAVSDKEYITNDILMQGFNKGSYLSKTSLLNPVEGTMITIIHSMAESMNNRGSRNNPDNIIESLDTALKTAKEKIFETPKLLPILAKAGVVDAGALGFIFFIDGMLRGLTDKKAEMEEENNYRFEPDLSINANVEKELCFKYCVEMTVENIKKVPEDDLKTFLKDNGNSIALLAEKEVIKLHIHTNEPDKVMEKMKGYGDITKTKIENMQEQVDNVLDSMKEQEDISILAIIPGSGFKDIYNDFGVNDFLEYKVNLPSSGEILEALDNLSNHNIIILPNNKNIVPAAMLAKEQSEKNVAIVRTNNVIQGLAALYSFSEVDSSEENLRNMSESIQLSICLMAYKSIKDSTFADVKINENDYFVVDGDELLSTNASLQGAVINALKKMDLTDKAIVTLYYQSENDKSIIEQLKNSMKEFNEALEVEIKYGGQEKAVLIISVE
jgi:DAK2 domain fusion protein YloV